jgi:GNAT superfamily N-acetyltransferase
VSYGQIEPISPEHDTKEFDSGSDAQTLWLRKHALQAQRSNSSRVQVVTVEGSNRVVGYYALTVGAVAHENATARLTRGMPRYPIPVVTITRLGVDHSEQGKGLGKALLKDALLRIASAAEEVAARAVLIHCEDEQAKAFYLSQAEFETSPTDPLHLFLLVSEIRKAVGLASG